ncbi:MAG: LamB/YcsF family protein [Geminicoccaceae bacterium]
MATKININADMAEGYGAYDIGDDLTLLGLVRSANIACGMHGGDPTVMHRVVSEAKVRGVSIGAHPGFNDLWGFGRRQIQMRASDLEHLVSYQIGALLGIATAGGYRVTHVKAHGALNNMAAVELDYSLAIGRAVRAVDRDLIFLVLSGSQTETAAKQLDLPFAREAFVDRTYEDDGNLTSRRIEGSVIRDPRMAADRVVDMVGSQQVTSRQGNRIDIPFESLCVHGDEPTSVAVATAARSALEDARVEIVTLPEML